MNYFNYFTEIEDRFLAAPRLDPAPLHLRLGADRNLARGWHPSRSRPPRHRRSLRQARRPAPPRPRPPPAQSQRTSLVRPVRPRSHRTVPRGRHRLRSHHNRTARHRLRPRPHRHATSTATPPSSSNPPATSRPSPPRQPRSSRPPQAARPPARVPHLRNERGESRGGNTTAPPPRRPRPHPHRPRREALRRPARLRPRARTDLPPRTSRPRARTLPRQDAGASDQTDPAAVPAKASPRSPRAATPQPLLHAPRMTTLPPTRPRTDHRPAHTSAPAAAASSSTSPTRPSSPARPSSLRTLLAAAVPNPPELQLHASPPFGLPQPHPPDSGPT